MFGGILASLSPTEALDFSSPSAGRERRQDIRMKRATDLQQLVVGRSLTAESSSSTESSPNLLSDSGNLRLGGFEIGREGVVVVVETSKSAAESRLEAEQQQRQERSPVDERSEYTHGNREDEDERGGVSGTARRGDADFSDLQPLQIIGRGASGFVRRAEHLPSGRMMAIKEICISDPARRAQILKEIETLRASTSSSSAQLMQYECVRYREGSIQSMQPAPDEPCGGARRPAPDLPPSLPPLSCSAHAHPPHVPPPPCLPAR
jgi:hypothetical protein